MPASELCEVVITAPDPDWLLEFSRQLVTDGLCASAHNFQPVRSVYRWRGEVHERTEGRVSHCILPEPGCRRSSNESALVIPTKCRELQPGQ
jgi:hypothetical protein